MRLTVHGTEGPLVVKLAGIAGGIRLYDEEIARVAASGFRVAALDISGDRRDDPPQRPVDWDVYADEVRDAIDLAPASRAVVWGTSFGCLIALAAASRHPQLISGLLLSHPPDPLWRPRLHRALLGFAERRADPDLVARVMFSTAFLGLTSWEGLAPALWVRLPKLMRASLDAATPPGTVKRKIELLFRDDPGLPPRDAGIPVEMIVGAWDLVAPRSGALRLAARIPGAKIHVMGYSGHAGAYTRPRDYLAITLAALRRLGNR
jgi:3-oxoadipate enol-lactonase